MEDGARIAAGRTGPRRAGCRSRGNARRKTPSTASCGSNRPSSFHASAVAWQPMQFALSSVVSRLPSASSSSSPPGVGNQPSGRARRRAGVHAAGHRARKETGVRPRSPDPKTASTGYRRRIGARRSEPDTSVDLDFVGWLRSDPRWPGDRPRQHLVGEPAVARLPGHDPRSAGHRMFRLRRRNVRVAGAAGLRAHPFGRARQGGGAARWSQLPDGKVLPVGRRHCHIPITPPVEDRWKRVFPGTSARPPSWPSCARKERPARAFTLRSWPARRAVGTRSVRERAGCPRCSPVVTRNWPLPNVGSENSPPAACRPRACSSTGPAERARRCCSSELLGGRKNSGCVPSSSPRQRFAARTAWLRT